MDELLVSTTPGEKEKVVSRSESLTLSAVDEESFANEYPREWLSTEGEDEQPIIDGKSAESDDGEIDSTEENKKKTFLDEEQLEKMSNMANTAGAKAAEAGLQLSYLLRNGIHKGMAGMAKHLETIEQVVQNQIDEAKRQTQEQPKRRIKMESRLAQEVTEEEREPVEEREHDFEDSQSWEEGERAPASTYSMEEEEAPSLLSSKQRSFEQSTVSSMGDTFQEYIKPRLIETARAVPSFKRFGEREVDTEKESNQPRFIDFSQRKLTPKKIKFVKTPPSTPKKSPRKATEEVQKSSTMQQRRLIKAGELKGLKSPTRPQEEKVAETRRPKTPAKSRGDDELPMRRGRGRSRSRSRSRSRRRSKSRGRSRSLDAPRSSSQRRQENPRERSLLRHASTKRPQQSQKQPVSQPAEKSRTPTQETKRTPAKKRPTTPTANEKEKPKTWSEAMKKKTTAKVKVTKPKLSDSLLDSDQTQADDLSVVLSPKSNVPNTAEVDPEMNEAEGIEMVPFKVRNGASGLLIINAGECTLSKTPKAVRSALEGRRVKTPQSINPNPNPKTTKGRSTPPPRFPVNKSVSEVVTKKTLWGRRGCKSPIQVSSSPSKRKNPRITRKAVAAMVFQHANKIRGAATPNATKKKGVATPRTRKFRSHSPTEMNEMVDAITKFKLTAQKLGVAEQDLLRAMSFASRTEVGDGHGEAVGEEQAYEHYEDEVSEFSSSASSCSFTEESSYY